jgi:hypothetical protein
MPSPVIKKTQFKSMSFFEALKQAAQGKRIFKLEWQKKEIYGLMQKERLTIYGPDGLFHDWIISAGDMAGNDWIVL